MENLPTVFNLYEVTRNSRSEVIHPLFCGADFRLEHIVSFGEGSPPDFWYDQDTAEWVALIQGESVLQFEAGELKLRAGDALVIRAHLKHRVSETSNDAVWLSLHYKEQDHEQT